MKWLSHFQSLIRLYGGVLANTLDVSFRTWLPLLFVPGNELGLHLQLQQYSAEHTHQPGKVLATCSDSLCLLPKTRCELSAGSTGSSLLFLALLECCLSALLFCLLSPHFDHVRKLVFGLAALSQDNNLPLRPVTCC